MQTSPILYSNSQKQVAVTIWKGRWMKSDLLRAERIQHGWSQAKLAEALGVDTRTVRRWERGQAVPFPYYRKQLTTLFGKTPEELGLPSDSDEGNAIEQASLSVAQPTTPDAPAPTSF